MDIQFFFPTAICSIMDKNLAHKLLPVAKKYLNTPELLTYTWGYKNTYSSNNGLENQIEFKELVIFLKDQAANYMQSLGYDLSPEIFDINIFTSEMNNGDQHGMHTHQNSIVSGVFYLSVPENSSDIYFYDPRPFRKFVNYPLLENKETTWQNIRISPLEGLLLMWESWIEHEVPENNADGRITIVFNIFKK